MKKKVLLILIGLNAFFRINVSAQDSLYKYRLCFMAGNGIQYIGQLLGNDSHAIALNKSYFYQVSFYQLQFSYLLLRKKNFVIELLAQPQYNLTKYKLYDEDDDNHFLTGYETGLNIGVLLRKSLSRKFSYYVLLSTGPHYVSGVPHRQSSGFLFSDNLNIGLNLRLYKNLWFDIRPGFRHISNLGLTIPNAGVNDMTLTEGIWVGF